ncbi:MAG TPA: PQQ-dependent sugar dehydrogenase, partial [Kineobactrum sp.]
MHTPSLITRTFSALLLLASVAIAAADYTLETVADGLHHPWSLVQLPDGDFLVTERRGELLHISGNGTTRTVISGVPDTLVGGQGGFFDIVLHPGFSDNRLVYLAYARGTPQANGTAIMRARLEGTVLLDARDILWVKDKKDTVQHYGGRLLFLPDTTLLLATGDGFDYRDQAQVVGSELGKVLRINDDGSVPADNPFSEPGSERVWTLGHRNPQGLVLDSDSETVYLHEHGPKGGDELNLLKPGNNYGWPAVTHGVDYSGAYVSPFTDLPGMTAPVHYWVPSIAPSGLALYNGEHF